MSNLLDSFDQQFSILTADITSKTSRIPNLLGSDKKIVIDQVERHFEEAQELLEQVDVEITNMPPSQRVKYENRLSSYQNELKSLRKNLKHAKIAFSDDVHTREELFGEETEDQSIRLLDNTERLERSSRALEGGYKMTVETEHIGAEILNNLHTQRETIKKARERLRETDSDLGKSSRILSGMLRRILQNRLILYVIAGTIVIVIVLGIYFTVRRHS